MRERSLMTLLALLLVAAASPLPPQLSDPKTAEGWIWQRVQAGEVADLTDRCGRQPFDGIEIENERWQRDCRRVDPALLRALLIQPDLGDHSPHGVLIRGARIYGGLDLGDAHSRATEVGLNECWITGSVNLSDARLDGLLSLDGTLIEGDLDGERAVIGNNLSMRGAAFGP